jgi:hypothetical protein
MIHSICVFGGVFPVFTCLLALLVLLEFSVDGLPHTSANSVPFRGTIGPISDQSRTNLGQLHLARTHVATIKPPPADLPPALECSQYGLRPCHRFIALHGSCILCTCSPAGFCYGVLLHGFGAIAMRATHLDLGEATSEKRPRRCDLVCTSAPPRHSACILLSHADDASPEDLCPPRRPVPCSGTTAPRSRSDFRCNLANEIQSRLATSHRSALGRRAHLPY